MFSLACLEQLGDILGDEKRMVINLTRLGETVFSFSSFFWSCLQLEALMRKRTVNTLEISFSLFQMTNLAHECLGRLVWLDVTQNNGEKCFRAQSLRTQPGRSLLERTFFVVPIAGIFQMGKPTCFYFKVLFSL